MPVSRLLNNASFAQSLRLSVWVFASWGGRVRGREEKGRGRVLWELIVVSRETRSVIIVLLPRIDKFSSVVPATKGLKLTTVPVSQESEGITAVHVKKS